jgi:hypothetical protein
MPPLHAHVHCRYEERNSWMPCSDDSNKRSNATTTATGSRIRSTTHGRHPGNNYETHKTGGKRVSVSTSTEPIPTTSINCTNVLAQLGVTTFGPEGSGHKQGNPNQPPYIVPCSNHSALSPVHQGNLLDLHPNSDGCIGKNRRSKWKLAEEPACIDGRWYGSISDFRSEQRQLYDADD